MYVVGCTHHESARDLDELGNFDIFWEAQDTKGRLLGSRKCARKGSWQAVTNYYMQCSPIATQFCSFDSRRSNHFAYNKQEYQKIAYISRIMRVVLQAKRSPRSTV